MICTLASRGVLPWAAVFEFHLATGTLPPRRTVLFNQCPTFPFNSRVFLIRNNVPFLSAIAWNLAIVGIYCTSKGRPTGPSLIALNFGPSFLRRKKSEALFPPSPLYKKNGELLSANPSQVGPGQLVSSFHSRHCGNLSRNALEVLKQ